MAVADTTTLVERFHTQVAGYALSPLAALVPGGKLVRSAHNAIAGTVYATVRTTARGIGAAGGAGLAAAYSVGPFSVQGDIQRRLLEGVGVVNGICGDHLHHAHNPLDLGMTLHHADDFDPWSPTALVQRAPNLTNRLCIFVHGLCCTDQAWRLFAKHGELPMSARLCADFGLTPFYLRYNSGRHISENGRRLADVLGELVAAYPRPVDEIVLIGHSLGGLVARSAAHYAQLQKELWLAHLRRIIYLGTPHRGARLEQTAHGLSSLLGAIPVPGTLAPSAILNRRSAGIKDLRFGYTVDEEWQGHDPNVFLKNRRQALPPIKGVEYLSLATTVAHDPTHWTGQLLGDLLVRPTSAGGTGHRGRVYTLGNLNHFALLDHPEVYAVLRSSFESAVHRSEAIG